MNISSRRAGVDERACLLERGVIAMIESTRTRRPARAAAPPRHRALPSCGRPAFDQNVLARLGAPIAIGDSASFVVATITTSTSGRGRRPRCRRLRRPLAGRNRSRDGSRRARHEPRRGQRRRAPGDETATDDRDTGASSISPRASAVLGTMRRSVKCGIIEIAPPDPPRITR
jgi:hypothetical protein